MKKRKPLIIVVSSPSGGGKTTIVNNLLKNVSGIRRSISYTTRSPREGERDKEDYMFISEEEFNEKIRKDKLLEWEENFGHYYGTSQEQVEAALSKGEDVILSIDVKGARRVKKKFPGSVGVFIMPPSVEELTTRLEHRHTEKKDEMSTRLAESKREMAAQDEYDYLIVNKDLEEATEELKAIIEKEREKR